MHRHQPEPGREVHRRGAPRARGADRRAILRRHAGRSGSRARRGVSLPRARRVVAGGGRGVRRGAGTRHRPGGGFPGARSAPLRAVLRRAHGARAGVPLHVRAGRRAWEASCAAPQAIAAPGCFATAAQLALYPLARAGLDVTPSMFAITGSSGAGVQPRSTTHHPMRAHNVFAYSPLGHRHEAEVLQSWREWIGRPDAEARLMTHSGPFVRGIYLTLHAYLPRDLRSAPATRAPRRPAGIARPIVIAPSCACSMLRPS